MSEDLISDGDWNRVTGPLSECGPKMEDLLKSLLQGGDLRTHSVSHRIKTRDSTSRKIERKAQPEYSLANVTDVLGLRVITYFDHEVDRVAEIIETEFMVDRANSIDKRIPLESDRFGYLSLHYVVELGASRRGLKEYRKFCDIPFEIQIRSILQHAWAEIEHDLGYKSEQVIPAQVRRRFSRLAGLLELADEEFTYIRQSLEQYGHDVRTAVRDSLNVPINRDSVAAYIKESRRLTELADKLVQALGNTREPRENLVYAEARANELLMAGFENLDDVDRALEAEGECLWRFVRNWFQRPGRPGTRQKKTLDAGILLLYLAVGEATKRPDTDAKLLLNQLGAGDWDLDRLIAEHKSAENEAKERR